MTDLEASARRLAEEVLLPAAAETDRSALVPKESLDALADAGLYGIFAPPSVGGLGADLPATCSVVETLAGACLATTFVWIQHFGLLRAMLRAPEPLRSDWLEPVSRGEVRGGIALGGLLPGPAQLRARAHDGGWVLDGVAPWVSGWGRIDALHVAARGPDDTVVCAAVDAMEGGGLSVARRRLVAVDASGTVRAHFRSVPVPADRVVAIERFDPRATGGRTLRLNGSLALGVAARCCALIGPSRLDAELADCRRALDEADDDAMPAARARASELALRSAAALMVHEGSRSVEAGAEGQRLAREASFLLVFGSRPQIKAKLLATLGGPGG